MLVLNADKQGKNKIRNYYTLKTWHIKQKAYITKWQSEQILQKKKLNLLSR